MLLFLQSDANTKRVQFRSDCETEIHHLLDTGENLFDTYFPEAVIQVEGKKLGVNEVIRFRNSTLKAWVRQVLDDVIQACESGDFSIDPPKEIKIPQNVSGVLIRHLFNILSYHRDLSDNEFYLISDITTAMEFPPDRVAVIIDQVQY